MALANMTTITRLRRTHDSNDMTDIMDQGSAEGLRRFPRARADDALRALTVAAEGRMG